MAVKPVNWTNDLVMNFLELYAAEQLLWDTTHREHKLKHKNHDAWRRISQRMGNVAISELKFKKKSLMATFRPLIKKKKSSMRSACGDDEVYQPIWFAYDLMESFLGKNYDVEDSIKLEETEEQEDEMELSLTPSTHDEPPDMYDMSDAPPTPDNTTNVITTLGQRSTENTNMLLSDARRKINESFETLNNVLKRKRSEEEDDECDVYGKLLAKRLRKYPERIRDKIMYKIDGLLLENPPEEFS